MDSSPFSARRGKATVTSSHDFISDTQAKLRSNAKRVYGAPRVEQRYPKVLLSARRWHRSLWKRDFGTFPLADARQNYTSFRAHEKEALMSTNGT
jgi:hypothetical protein